MTIYNFSVRYRVLREISSKNIQTKSPIKKFIKYCMLNFFSVKLIYFEKKQLQSLND